MCFFPHVFLYQTLPLSLYFTLCCDSSFTSTFVFQACPYRFYFFWTFRAVFVLLLGCSFLSCFTVTLLYRIVNHAYASIDSHNWNQWIYRRWNITSNLRLPIILFVLHPSTDLREGTLLPPLFPWWSKRILSSLWKLLWYTNDFTNWQMKELNNVPITQVVVAKSTLAKLRSTNAYYSFRKMQRFVAMLIHSR